MTASKKPVMLSAIQPSGNFTIANYIGAIRNWKTMQNEHDCLFFLVDLHAITVRQDPAKLRERSLDLISLYLACGIDPEKSIVFAQSHVPAHAELAWVLSCYTQMGDATRMTQFKDKSAKHAQNINVGLLSYPMLMAADILLYKTNVVPVGDDQKQHIELTRDLAEKFNNLYGETFIIPEPYIAKEGARIMNLQDPTSKMSKSDTVEKNYISLLDSPEAVLKKCKSAVTDSEGRVAFDKERPGISNLVQIMGSLNGMSFEEIQEKYEGQGYGTFKEDLADVINQTLAPIQAKYATIRNDESYLAEVLKDGAARANERANVTIREVYEKVGFLRGRV